MKSKDKFKYTIEDHAFSKQEIELFRENKKKIKDARLQQRFIALILIAEGTSVAAVLSALDIHFRTLDNWFSNYINKGIESLSTFQYKPNKALLDEDQIGKLIKWVKDKLPGNRDIIKEYIFENFGVCYDLSSITKLLNRHKIKRIRPILRPGNPPSIKKQEEFIARYHEVKQFQLQDPGIVQLFIDGMHLIHQIVPCFCWGDPKNRPVFPSNNSRNRLNILGAYDVQRHEFVHLSSEKNCDENKVIEFFELLLRVFPNKHSIVLYVDGAPYFHSKKVRKWLEARPQIIIDQLPAYAPNLNLIERLWRFVKGKLVKNRYFKQYKTFRASTFILLNNIKKWENELRSLITENFEIISKSSYTAIIEPGKT